MGQLISTEWRSWNDGVITAAEPDSIPKTAASRGYNSALTKLSPGVAAVMSRKGIVEANPTQITGSPAIIGQVEFKAYASGAYTTYHLLISSGGRLDYKDAATTTAVWDAATATPFSSSTNPYFWPDAAVAANCAFMGNGQSSNNWKAYIEGGSKKVRDWGIVRPTVGTLAGAAGAAGSPSGTYELRVSYVNTRTGVESSISNTATATVTVVNQQISWSNIPVSSDGQVDKRNLYVRNTSTQANFYLAGSVADNTTTTATTNTLDSALVTIGPDTAENDPPPSASVCEWHGSRMFVAGPNAPTTIFYSKLGSPEQFDPDFFEYINPIDGQSITGLHSTSGALLVFKRESTWILVGDDPSTWEILPLFKDVGAVSHRTIVTVEGITYWWSEQGPMSWDGGSRQPRPIGRGLLSNTIDPTVIAPAQMAGAMAVADAANQRILFALPETGFTKNNFIIPFNYGMNRWDAEEWRIIDVASFGVVDDSSSIPVIYIGSYSGQLFTFWSGLNDGVPSGTASGTVTSATSTTLTDSAAAFVTTGNSLVDRYVVAISPTNTIQRRRITANTATALTITPAWTTTPNINYTYIVGPIDFQWDTNAEDFGWAFGKKRIRFGFVQTRVDAATTLRIDLIRDDATSTTESRNFALTTGGSVYGTGVYGTATYGSGRSLSDRSRLSTTCQKCKIRFSHLVSGKGITLLKAALTGEFLDDSLGRGDTGTITT